MGEHCRLGFGRMDAESVADEAVGQWAAGLSSTATASLSNHDMRALRTMVRTVAMHAVSEDARLRLRHERGGCPCEESP